MRTPSLGSGTGTTAWFACPPCDPARVRAVNSVDRPLNGSPTSPMSFTPQRLGSRTPEGAAAPSGRIAANQAFVSQKILAISSIESSSFCPWSGSCDFLAVPASLVAFQNSSCSCGYFSTCSGLK